LGQVGATTKVGVDGPCDKLGCVQVDLLQVWRVNKQRAKVVDIVD